MYIRIWKTNLILGALLHDAMCVRVKLQPHKDLKQKATSKPKKKQGMDNKKKPVLPLVHRDGPNRDSQDLERI